MKRNAAACHKVATTSSSQDKVNKSPYKSSTQHKVAQNQGEKSRQPVYASSVRGRPSFTESSDDDPESSKLIIDLNRTSDSDHQTAVSTSQNSESFDGAETADTSSEYVQHHSSIDDGLKMKIKRKNSAQAAQAAKTDSKSGPDGNKSVNKTSIHPGSPSDKISQSGNISTNSMEKLKSVLTDKDKTKASKTVLKKDKGVKGKSDTLVGTTTNAPSGNSPLSQGTQYQGGHFSSSYIPQSASGNYEQERVSAPKTPTSDPYEFNAKVEDHIDLPVKKIKLDKNEPCYGDREMRDVGVETCNMEVMTDPECLGPCEPGTSILLQGIVWHETENGMLVVNVTWRGKTYIGTLIDATIHKFSPPNFRNGGLSDTDLKTPRGGRAARRGRSAATQQDFQIERKLRSSRRNNSSSTFTAPPSPAKSDASVSTKRKTRQDSDAEESKQPSKKNKTGNNRQSGTNVKKEDEEEEMFSCSEAGCSKKYKNTSGLQYHIDHAHNKVSDMPDKKDTNTKPTGKNEQSSKASVTSSSDDKTCDSDSNSKDSISSKDVPQSKTSKDVKDKPTADKKTVQKEQTVVKTPAVVIKPVTVAASPKKTNPVVEIKKEPVEVKETVTTKPTGSKLSEALTLPIRQSQHLHLSSVSVPNRSVAQVVTSTQKYRVSASAVSSSGHAPIPGTSTVHVTRTISLPVAVPSQPPPNQQSSSPKDKNKQEVKKAKVAPIILSHNSGASSLPCSSAPVSTISTVTPVQAGLSVTPMIVSMQNKPTHITAPIVNIPKADIIKDGKSSDNRLFLSDKDHKLDHPVSKMGDSLSSVIRTAPSHFRINEGLIVKPAGEHSKFHETSFQTHIKPIDLVNKTGHLKTLGRASPQDLTDSDVHSPAYSDISDANDAATGSVDGDDGPGKPDKRQVPFDSYPGQFGQPQYIAQNPMQTPPIRQPPGSDEKGGISSNRSPDDNRPSSRTSNDEKLRSALTPEQQAQRQRQIAQAYGLQQYPYSVGPYGYPMDPAYHMHLMATSQHYRAQHERAMQQQKQREGERPRESGRSSVDSNQSAGPSSTSGSTDGRPEQKHPSAALGKPPALMSDREREDYRRRELEHRNLKEKQMENQQILKENLELKTQMDKQGVSYDQKVLFERQQEELKRYYMFQQQKLLEQQKFNPDVKREGGAQSLPSPKPRTAINDLERSPSAQDLSPRQRDNDVKRLEDKLRCDETLPSPRSTPKSRTETSTPSRTTPSSSASVLPGNYPQFYPGSYLPPNYSGPLPQTMYPGVNPAMMGYSHGSPYIHPSQMSPQGIPREGKALELLQQQASQYYGGAHKIHELGKERKSQDRDPSPAPSPAAGIKKELPVDKHKVGIPPPKDPQRDGRDSPPPQRHLHTHHHTHVLGGAYPNLPIYALVPGSGPPTTAASHSGSNQPPFSSSSK